jgi:hypothetical protein
MLWSSYGKQDCVYIAQTLQISYIPGADAAVAQKNAPGEDKDGFCRPGNESPPLPLPGVCAPN